MVKEPKQIQLDTASLNTGWFHMLEVCLKAYSIITFPLWYKIWTQLFHHSALIYKATKNRILPAQPLLGYYYIYIYKYK